MTSRLDLNPIQQFLQHQEDNDALTSCETIDKCNMYPKLTQAVCASNFTKKDQFILNLRLAQYVHFVDSLYDLSLFGCYLRAAKRCISAAEVPILMVAQYYSELSLYQIRISNELKGKQKTELITAAYKATQQAIALLETKKTNMEELYRAHTYAANCSMLLDDYPAAQKHFKATRQYDVEVNDTYKFGNRLYLIRYYSHTQEIDKRDSILQECRALINTVTSLFDKSKLTEMLAFM